MRGRFAAFLLAILVVGGIVFRTEKVTPVYAANISGDITSNTVLDVTGSPWIVTGNVQVKSGFTLTINPGVTVKFDNGTHLIVESGASLVAEGTGPLPITFTTNDGAPARGKWRRIGLNAGSTSSLRFCTVEYAGSDNAAAIVIDSSNATIRDCTVRQSMGDGVHLTTNNISPTIQDTTITQSDRGAIAQSSAQMRPNYLNLTLAGNDATAGYVVGIGSGIVGTAHAIVDGSGLNGVPIVATQGLDINASQVLTITPGTILTLFPGQLIYVRDGGTLFAEGTAAKPITVTANTTRWANFYVQGALYLRHCLVEKAGSGGYSPTIWAFNGSPGVSILSVRDCTIRDGNGFNGIRMDGPNRVSTIQNVTITGHSAEPLVTDTLGQSRNISNVTLTGNTNNRWYFLGGDVTTPVEIGSHMVNGAPLVIGYRPQIQAGGILTISPGSLVKFDGNQGIYPVNGGRLFAKGTPTQPITFTSALTSPVPGSWDTLFISNGPTSRMDLSYCLVEYAGAGAAAAVSWWDGVGSVDHCTIQNNIRSGLEAQYSTSPTWTNTILQNNAAAGIRINRQASPSFGNLTIRNAPGDAIEHQSNNWPKITGPIVMENNGRDAFVISKHPFAAASVAGDFIMDGGGYLGGRPFIIDSNMVFAAGTVTVTPGSTIKFGAGIGLDIQVTGKFLAEGQPLNPITFTTVSTLTTPGQWTGIALGGQSRLSNCVVDRGGASRGALTVQVTNVSITSCRIVNNQTGLQTTSSAQPGLTYNHFIGNSTFGVQNLTPASVVDARRNWWGSATGPQHATNPGGTGDKISNGVLFDPWLLDPWLSAPTLFPRSGGAFGESTVTVNSISPILTSTTQVSLNRTGQTAIIGKNGDVMNGGTAMRVTFPLQNTALGLWDLVVKPAGNRTITTTNEFEVKEARFADVRLEFLGPSFVRRKTWIPYAAVATNVGNVDAPGAVGILGISELSNFVEVNPIRGWGMPAVPSGLIPAAPVLSTVNSEQQTRFLAPSSRCGDIFAALLQLKFLPGSPSSLELPLFRIGPDGRQPRPITIPTTTTLYEVPIADQAALQQALQTMQNAGSNANFRHDSCYDSSFGMYGQMQQLAAAVGSALQGWTVEPVTNASGTVGNIRLALTSPATGQIYLLDTRLVGPTLNPARRNGSGISLDDEALIANRTQSLVDLGFTQPVYRPITQRQESRVCEEQSSSGGGGGGGGTIDPATKPPMPVPVPPTFVGPVQATDPNAKYGPPGVGGPRYIAADRPMPYMITFENVMTATAPALEVVVTDQIDTGAFDVTTFSFGAFGFGTMVGTPNGRQEFIQTIDLRPGKPYLVRITGLLNPTTGLATWRYTTINPTTGQIPIGATDGFLPPNTDDVSPAGQGWAMYSIQPKSGLPEGTLLKNKATIVFDTENPISTNEWSNTIDRNAPSSAAIALPATAISRTFTVQWSGSDAVSGVQSYSVYASKDGGAFEPLLVETAATSVTFHGEASHTYRFYSIARDGAGNLEAPKSTAEATTTTPGDLPAGPSMVFLPISAVGAQQ